MRIRRAPLVAVAFAIALGAAGTVTAPGSSGGVPPAGQIVFASDRATATPGALYSLAAGRPARLLAPRQFIAQGIATSPKGRAYAFWSDRSGPFRLLVAPSGGAALRTVVIGGRAGADPQYPSTPPAFSPDGRRLLITYIPAGSIGPRPRFALADVRSGPAKPLELPCEEAPVWSPDGLLLACTDLQLRRVFVADLQGHVQFSAPGTAVFWAADGRLAIAGTARTAIVNTRGHVLAEMTGVARAWSPDGRYLALTRDTALVLAQPGRPAADRVVAGGGKDDQYYWLAFTPDGRDVGYAGGTGQAQLVPVAGGPSRQLAAGFGDTWAPDDRLAFPVITGTTVAIEIGDRLGRHARVVARLPFDDHGLFTLAWLGDGSRLFANVSTRDHADLWTMTAGGSAQSRLTGAGERIGEPAWSADGTRLAFDDATFSGGNCGYCGGNVVAADATGRKPSAIPGADGGVSADTSPSWAPSGTQIAVSNAFNGGIFAVGLDGSGRTQLAPDAAASPAWSPDGSTVAYVDSFGGGAVWGVDPTGADARRLLPLSKLKALAVTWSPDGALLALRTGTGVYVAPADGSAAPRLVAAAAGDADHPRLSFSPDGAWIAFTADAGTAHPYSAIFIAGVDGSGLHRLTRGPFDSFDPAWRPMKPQS